MCRGLGFVPRLDRRPDVLAFRARSRVLLAFVITWSRKTSFAWTSLLFDDAMAFNRGVIGSSPRAKELAQAGHQRGEGREKK